MQTRYCDSGDSGRPLRFDAVRRTARVEPTRIARWNRENWIPESSELVHDADPKWTNPRDARRPAEPASLATVPAPRFTLTKHDCEEKP